MSTVEDFENAPAGATAYREDIGLAMKVGDLFKSWVTPDGTYLSDVQMEIWGYRLTSAREALDLAWKLAHPVREGQAIPKDTRYLKRTDSGLAVFVAQFDFKVQPGIVSVVRTLEPLPDPEPDWQEAPAVIASTSTCPDRKIWVPQIYNPEYGGVWKCSCCRDEVHWYELVDVTPLYPNVKETK